MICNENGQLVIRPAAQIKSEYTPGVSPASQSGQRHRDRLQLQKALKEAEGEEYW